MWPTSTSTWAITPAKDVLFQSLKRDVAYFHALIAGGDAAVQYLFQSLKRDVAYFHSVERSQVSAIMLSFNRSSAMWPTST